MIQVKYSINSCLIILCYIITDQKEYAKNSRKTCVCNKGGKIVTPYVLNKSILTAGTTITPCMQVLPFTVD